MSLEGKFDISDFGKPPVCATEGCGHPPPTHMNLDERELGCRVTGCKCAAWTSRDEPLGEALDVSGGNLTIGLPAGRKARVTIEVYE